MPTLTLEQQDKIDRLGKLAREFEQKYGNCPQCVLHAVREVFGHVDETVFAFGGGGAGTIEGTCGALCGAMMVVAAAAVR